MHRINRVEVELHTGEAALARALSERVGRMHGDRIAPVLDRVCSELGGSEALFRIDRLELDLGTLAADDFESGFIGRLEPALRAALARALWRTAGDQRAQASLEVLEIFALTGSLPWWAPQDSEVVARHFARAAAQAEAELGALLGRIARDPGALDRIARMCDRGALVALAERAQVARQLPGDSDQDERRMLLSALAARGGPRQAAARSAAGREATEPVRNPSALRAPRPAPSSGARDAWGRPALDEHARSASLSTGDQPMTQQPMAQRPSTTSRHTGDAPRLHQPTDPTSLDERQPLAPGTLASTGARDAGSPPALDDHARSARPPTGDQPMTQQPMAQRPSAASRHTGDAPRLRQPADRTSLDDQQPLAPGTLAPSSGEHAAWGRPALDDPARSARPPTGDEPMAQRPSTTSRHTGDAPRLRQPTDPTSLDDQQPPAPGTLASSGARDAGTNPALDDPARPGHPPTGDEPMAQRPSTTSRHTGDAPRLRQPTDPTSLTERRTPPPRTRPMPSVPAAIRASRRGAFARLDELYVEDAGLVILWPFLERFFVRTGVLGDDRRFLDEAAQLQAVELVEILATADPAPPEFRLPLAKLLCGRPLESDFLLERPLTPEQLAEADRLLTAVIDGVPVLGELSVPSFRAGFLVRSGALGTRDGAWLLQVERRPHDAVLDRFPWSWGWIKLPWMPEPLRVEW